MPGTSDPPRPHLSLAVRNYLAACTWDAGQGRLEDGSGNAVAAWLNQSGSTAVTNPVVWEVGTTSQASSSVQATVVQTTYNIVKNGTYNQATGLVSYNGSNYKFAFVVSGGVASMIATT